jgi:glycerol-3-phosphate acyltransferase PlsX
MHQSRIALDVMGGDDAPQAPVLGALRACSASARCASRPSASCSWATRRASALLDEHGGNPGFALRHASQVIEMGESPAQALRAKKDSSIGSSVSPCSEGEAGPWSAWATPAHAWPRPPCSSAP